MNLVVYSDTIFYNLNSDGCLEKENKVIKVEYKNKDNDMIYVELLINGDNKMGNSFLSNIYLCMSYKIIKKIFK